jgi:hypothetical protein
VIIKMNRETHDVCAEQHVCCHRDARGSMEPLLGGSIGHRASLEGGRTAADIAMSAAEAAAAEAAADDPGKAAPFHARVPWAKVGRLPSSHPGPVAVQPSSPCCDLLSTNAQTEQLTYKLSSCTYLRNTLASQ